MGLPGIQVLEHALAEATTGSPEEEQGLVTSEVGEANGLTRKVGQAEVRGRLTDLGESLRSGSAMAIAVGGSGHRQGDRQRQVYHAGQQGANGIRSLCQWAAKRAITPNEHSAGRAMGLVGLCHLPVLLQQHMSEPMFTGFSTIGLRC